MATQRTRGLVSRAFLADASGQAKQRFRDFIKLAGLRMRTEGDNLAIRSDASPPDLVYAKPLQTKAGQLRVDAAKTLAGDELLDDAQVAETTSFFQERYADFFSTGERRASILPTTHDGVQLELLANADPVPVLARWLESWDHRVRLFRLVTTPALHKRDLFWRLVTAFEQDGITWNGMIESGEWPTINQISGTVISQAAFWVTGPMTARHQPFAAVFSTARGAEVLAIPQGAWDRSPYQPLGWPVGFGGVQLSGSGEDAYATRHRAGSIPKTIAGDLLAALVDGTNRLLAHLTDPGTWTAADGQIDPIERNIAWSTVNLGLTTIKGIARSWGTDDSVWGAFRAISILEGFWSGSRQNKVGLDALLHPEIVERHAVPTLEPPWLREWAVDTVANYRDAIAKMYPGVPLDQGVERMRELRNLVHGTGAVPSARRRRDARLDALLGTGVGNVQLVRDVANFWWSSVLLAPASHARMGIAPFAQQP